MSRPPELPGSVDPDLTSYADREVVFRDRFTLGASPEVYPAGTYVIETGDRMYEGTGHTAHVRNSTVLIIQTASSTRHIHVSESELRAALNADAERHRQLPNENPDRGQTGVEEA